MNIELHIERLILDGVTLPYGQHPHFQAAVEAELARLLLAGGLHPELAAGGAVPHLRGGQMQLAAQNSPSQLGQQIAQAVYHSLQPAQPAEGQP